MGKPSKPSERQQANERLLKFESMKRWLGTETIRSKNTRDCYLYHFSLLLEHVKMTPDEFMTERVKDMAQQDFIARTRMEVKVREFKTDLEKNKGKYTAFQMVAAACSFLKANTGARLNINNPPPEPEHDVWIYDGEPSGEQTFWQRVIDHTRNVRDAAAFMVGLEAGPRDGSILKMIIGDVVGGFMSGPAPYAIRIPPPGESETRKSGGFGFIAEDARKKIEEYLALRKARGFSAGMTDPFIVDLETGKPLMSADALNDGLRHAFLDAGALSRDQVYPPDVRMSPVRWYCLRKRTQTIMEDNTDGTGIALNWVDALLSHRKRGAQAAAYSKPTVPQLREAYARAMHRLMIYREARREVTQDQVDQAVQRVLRGLMSEKVPRELEKMRDQTMTGAQLAKIFRELMSLSKEAE
jgi:hypothetical protein